MSKPSVPSNMLDIIESIGRLPFHERRQLFRRLRASGLFVPEMLQSDRNRLEVATSVRQPTFPITSVALQHEKTFVPPGQVSAEPATAKPIPAERVVTERPKQTSPVVTAPPTAREQAAGSLEYHSAVSGRSVALGDSTPAAEQPHLMAPLPGQAPDQPIGIIFDGGSRGNPGEGYGSYQLHWPGSSAQTVRLRFGNRVTNNEAEYDTLIAALEAVQKRLGDGHADLSTATIDIRGDSLLVINQVLGKWKVNEERMAVRRDQVRTMLKRFGNWRLIHHDRANSVKALGH